MIPSLTIGENSCSITPTPPTISGIRRAWKLLDRRNKCLIPDTNEAKKRNKSSTSAKKTK